MSNPESGYFSSPVCTMCGEHKPAIELFGTCKSCRDRLSQLESSLAELQRVVQVKDEALKAVSYECRSPHQWATKVDEALELTPTNLPKLIPEEEYLRVKEDYAEVKQDHDRLVREIDVILYGEAGAAKQASLCDLIKPIERLKTHAEAMVQRLDQYRFIDGINAYKLIEEYRKDFPKEDSDEC